MVGEADGELLGIKLGFGVGRPSKYDGSFVGLVTGAHEGALEGCGVGLLAT